MKVFRGLLIYCRGGSRYQHGTHSRAGPRRSRGIADFKVGVDWPRTYCGGLC